MDNKPDNAPAPDEKADLAQVKTMLDLPATATDIELITVLVNLVTDLQAKYETLLADAVAMEDNLANRELSDFSDVIDEGSKGFWKEQILTNRSVALEALGALRSRLAQAAAPAVPPEAETRVIPLRNRLAAIERSVQTIASGVPSQDESVAVKIRNRAHEIARSDNVPFLIAFARAEREIAA